MGDFGMEYAWDKAIEEEATKRTCEIHGTYIAGYEESPCPQCEDGEDLGEENV